LPGVSKAQELGTRGCRLSQLALGIGPWISEATGQHTLAVRLVNRGPTPCVLDGYPTIRLSDRAGTIPFVIRHGGDQMVTSDRPRRVLVGSSHATFVVLNHYRCDLGGIPAARTLSLGLPHAPRAQSATIAIRPRQRWIDYCDKGDRGSTVSVSPFEPNLRAALEH